MALVVITGARGTVGKVLAPQIGQEHEVIPIDLPETDILDAERLHQALNGADVVIHLAGIFGSKAEGKEIYAVSNNTGRFHDVTNPYNWMPRADSTDYL